MIDKFAGRYRFLSNFYYGPVYLDGVEYNTVEHAYQAAKNNDIVYRDMVWRAKTPSIAKSIGRKAVLRKDWEDVKLDIMYRLVKEKFSKEPRRTQLLATGLEELIEGNYWNDTFWGMCNGKGENYLGKILMRVRTELRDGPQT